MIKVYLVILILFSFSINYAFRIQRIFILTFVKRIIDSLSKYLYILNLVFNSKFTGLNFLNLYAEESYTLFH